MPFFSTLMKSKSLSEIMALLLDGRLQGLLANPKVSECMKSKPPLLLPWIAIRQHETFWIHKTNIKPQVSGKQSAYTQLHNSLIANMTKTVSVWCFYPDWKLTSSFLNKMQHTLPWFPNESSNIGMLGRSTKSSPFWTRASLTSL